MSLIATSPTLLDVEPVVLNLQCVTQAHNRDTFGKKHPPTQTHPRDVFEQVCQRAHGVQMEDRVMVQVKCHHVDPDECSVSFKHFVCVLGRGHHELLIAMAPSLPVSPDGAQNIFENFFWCL
jgi:hypothetical protein